MSTNNEPVNPLEETELLQEPNRSPECSKTTTWITCYHGRFRIDITVIGIESDQSNCYLPLSRGQSEAVNQAVADIVKALEEQLR